MTPDWVYELRKEFPATQKSVFLDIAYENSGSLFARQAVQSFFDDWGDVSPNVVKASGEGKGRIVDVGLRTRALLSELLGGVDPNHIAFTRNTNEGISAILQGFDWQSGDNVVVCEQEHPTVLMPCLNLRRRGVECRVAISPDDVSVTPELLLDLADDNTRMIVVSHVQSCSGYRIDLQRLAAECRKRGIFLIVDAIQSLGFCPVNAKEWGVDAIASACYKGLLGTSGIGFLYCTPELLKRVWPVYAAANRFLKVNRESWTLEGGDCDDAHKLENCTYDFIGVYALCEGLERITAIGIDAIAKHISDLFEKLYSGLQDLGFSLATPATPGERCHSISIRTPDPQALYQHFQQNGIFLSLSAGKYVRMSIAPFTTEEDIDRALAVAALWK